MLRIAAFIAAFFSVNCVIGQPLKEGNILIVYLSRTNNTKAVAEFIVQFLKDFQSKVG